jgi:recombination protein RecT
MNNQITTLPQMTSFLTADATKNKINQIVGDKRDGAKFISTIVSAVQQTPALVQCEPGSLINGALLAHTLGLEPSPQLGYFYLVPFNKSVKNKDGSWGKIKIATPVIGYKGYIQLALRTGQYKVINALEVKRGELKSFNRLTEEIKFDWIENDEERVKLPTTGYVSVIQLNNGFFKALYWSKEKMDQHAIKYSTSYATDLKNNKKDSFWSQNFDEQAKKTMLRQIISKYGILSSELQDALKKDTALINEDGNLEYVDNIKSDLVNSDEEANEVSDGVVTINEQQQDELLQSIVNKGFKVPEWFKSKGIENVNYITVEEYENYMIELKK